MRTRFYPALSAAWLGLLLSFCLPALLQAYTDLTTAQVHDRILAGGPLVILDVRDNIPTHDEFCGNLHIADAVNLPWNTNVLQARYGELPTDRDIIVLCAAGGRSAQAAAFLETKGFTRVFNMLGGMGAWTYETEACGTWPVLKLAKTVDGIETNWIPVTGTQDYDLLRGLLENLAVNGSTIDLGPIDCLAKTTPFTYFADVDLPVSGHPSFYLPRQTGGSWGQSSAGEERVPATTNCD
jgi:rhodanese-related sulfurtransferase